MRIRGLGCRDSPLIPKSAGRPGGLMRTLGVSGIVLLSVFVLGAWLVPGQDEEPSILVMGSYVESWHQELDWIRGFEGREVLTLCGSELRMDRVAVTKLSQSEREWREINVSTGCGGSFVLSGLEELEPGPITGEVYHHRFGEEGALEIVLGQMKAEFSLEIRESDEYDLVLRVGGEKRVLAERSPFSNRFYIPDELIWAGDLDSDNLLDFVINLSPHCPPDHQLFLSGGGQDGGYRVISQVERGGCI
jgi:hypothetical protein